MNELMVLFSAIVIEKKQKMYFKLVLSVEVSFLNYQMEHYIVIVVMIENNQLRIILLNMGYPYNFTKNMENFYVN